MPARRTEQWIQNPQKYQNIPRWYPQGGILRTTEAVSRGSGPPTPAKTRKMRASLMKKAVLLGWGGKNREKEINRGRRKEPAAQSRNGRCEKKNIRDWRGEHQLKGKQYELVDQKPPSSDAARPPADRRKGGA